MVGGEEGGQVAAADCVGRGRAEGEDRWRGRRG